MNKSRVVRVVHARPDDLAARVEDKEIVGVYVCHTDDCITHLWGKSYKDVSSIRVSDSPTGDLAKKFIVAAGVKGANVAGRKEVDGVSGKIFILYYGLDKKEKVYRVGLNELQ